VLKALLAPRSIAVVGASSRPGKGGYRMVDNLIRGYQGAEARERTNHIVELVHLNEVYDQRIETLSKGYRRRVGVAQALIHDPPVVILDEPTDGLDPNQKHEMRGIIQRMSPDKAIIISTHLLDEVEAVCSRAIIIAPAMSAARTTEGEAPVSRT